MKCITKAEYFNWIIGNPDDYKLPDESVLDGGILLGGGSNDQDEAYIWFLNKARGGDILVFRNAGDDETIDEYPNVDEYNSLNTIPIYLDNLVLK